MRTYRADGNAGDRNIHILAAGLAIALQLLHVDLPRKRDGGCRAGVLRQQNRGKVLVTHPREVDGCVQRFAANDFFEREVVFLAAGHGFKGAGVVIQRLFLVAEAPRPRQQRTHRCPVLQYRRLRLDHIRLVEGKGLRHIEATLRVVKRQRLRREKRPRCGGNEKCAVQVIRQCLVVGVQRQRKPELLCGLAVYQVERRAVTVFLALEHPRAHDAAPAGKLDTIERALDRDGVFCRADHDRHRRLLHGLRIERRGRPGRRGRLRGGSRVRCRRGRGGLLQRLRLAAAVQLRRGKHDDHGQHGVEQQLVFRTAAARIGITNFCQVLPLLARASCWIARKPRCRCGVEAQAGPLLMINTHAQLCRAQCLHRAA